MFTKILIANRGEIAVRVMRACREMGIRAVAVFSEVDRKSLHVHKADEAYPIRPAPASESYLRIDKIIAVARQSGAEAIHPGYGFLAENPELARACDEAKITFIGPSAEAMELMGSKTRARQAMMAAGVPVVPGTASGITNLEEAYRVAEPLGYPIMVKAAAGGGGKGLRLVWSPDGLPSAFRDARSEAENAFGDSEVYIEKYLEKPRHIEIQVLGDRHGNIVYLGERECSIQRRHQKVMEECPSPIVDAEMRRRMGEAAVSAARAAGYYNAGTVEFLVDAERNFYFLEMNTRLQVEHPITELVTGIDLVRQQIRIAAGEKLPFQQKDIALRGAALECRVYAEDPENSFFPCPGRIRSLAVPSGPGVRDDGGVYAGWTVPVEYDPLLSKLCVWGASRQEAIERMRRALDEYYVEGIRTNLGLFKTILRFPDFLEGRLDTELIDRLLAPFHEAPRAAGRGTGLAHEQSAPVGRILHEALEEDRLLAAALAAVLFETARHLTPAQPDASVARSNWKMEGRRRLLRQPSSGFRS
ncbi:MAG: acetyl-CoA carboxylase biotin carboxylase subunit [Acidobacteria bacterium RIFCSPLOWO2_02_FULL_59_13]|nr:MAG: acetyl-CoA carboxylase biotin carboxylase subunit [Acidobacteria bacterium RIFCSPLOWO2_02_FULL_59_13]